MSPKLFCASLIVCGVGISACGGSGSSTSSRRPGNPGSRPTRVYRIRLAGSAEPSNGAHGATGAAVIAFHGQRIICWRFAHLHGFADATSARIYSGAAGQTGRIVVSLSPGPHLHHQGCVSTGAAVAGAIWADPGAYYVSVHSRQYPRGAVRAQL